MTRLMGLKFKIVYNKGKNNVAADALSRIAHLMTMQAVSEVQPAWLQEVVNSYTTDTLAQKLLTRLAISSSDASGYTLEQGIIKKQGRIWIGHNSALQTRIIVALHASAMGGHSGVNATYQRLKQYFSWHGMKVSVEDYVKQCAVCQHAKHTNTAPAGLLQPLPIPRGIWQDLSMDFIEGLPKSEGYSVILVVVDRLTKAAHFIPLKHPYTALTVAKVFLDSVVRLHGLLVSLVSDHDPIFISAFWRELFKLYKVQLALSTAYHPQSDGQTERVNQCLEMYLRCAVHDTPTQWKSWLPLAELWYNATFHTALGCSPFKALFGYDPNIGCSVMTSPTTPPTVIDLIKTRELHLQSLKHHLAAAQNRMKMQADKKRSDLEFQLGERVLLKLQPYTQTSVANRPYPKLAFKYYGPYTVLERIGKVAYKLDLPDSSAIHPVFHVSQLKPFHSDFSPVFSTLPSTTDFSVVKTHSQLQSLIDAVLLLLKSKLHGLDFQILLLLGKIIQCFTSAFQQHPFGDKRHLRRGGLVMNGGGVQ
ncbi:hypothetical protein U9M48_003843 [Paspalum notatum var. saurae]|uniref:Integrase catalytic domain-containing protein n=1 Tax=Paspalum notatum var. saurae TaxID=547442 RepID=A0AAQ3PTR8_PASNO